MTTYTVSGIATLPNDTTPLAGTWYVEIYTDSGAAVDGDGSFRAGTTTVTTDAVTGAASVTLPSRAAPLYYSAYFRSADRQVVLGPYLFELTAATTWGAIMGSQVTAVVTPEALANHIANPTGAHAATAISFTPAGTIAATTAQAAVEEVATEAANADNLTSGTVADARIAATIARDSEVAAAVGAEADLRIAADATLQSIAGLDAAVAAFIGSGSGSTGPALDTRFVRRSYAELNILDYGNFLGTTATQTAAIKAVLDANPGKAFTFPDGDYRLDTTLVISQNNSIHLAAGARIYAGAAMDSLIDYDNGQSVSNYTQDKNFLGEGTLDCALLARYALSVGSVLRFGIGNGLTIKDPINRGILTKPAGAEATGNNIRLVNTGTTNSHRAMTVTTTATSTTVTRTAGDTFSANDVGSPIFATGIPVGATIATYVDANTVTISSAAIASGSVSAIANTNIAIEANMGDCRFTNITCRDFTVGVWDRNGNLWSDIQPWIGTTAQCTVRYPASIAFLLSGNSTLISPYADTMRYSFRTNNAGRSLSVTTNSTTTVTSSAGFLSTDVGSPIVAAGIPVGAVITGYTNSSSVTISATATASATVTGTILGLSKVRMSLPRMFCNTGNLTDALAAASPATVFQLDDGAEIIATNGRYAGHGVTAHTFLAGTTTRVNISGILDMVRGSVSGVAEYKRGAKMTNTFGSTTPTPFSPTCFGSTTAGTTSYTTQSGSMEVRDGMVWYRFRVTGTFGGTAAGNVRIGAFPFVPGATVVSTGHGPITRAVGIGTAVGIAGVNGTSGPTTGIPQTVAGAEVAVTASGAFDVWGEIAAPFTYPS